MAFKHLNIHNFPQLRATTTPEGRRYRVGDSLYPSVTTVIGHSKKKAILEWRQKVGEEQANAISKRASTRGNKCHKLCELYLENKSISQYSDDPLSMGLFYQIKPYLDSINNIHALEESLFSNVLKLAGRVDCIAEYNDELAIIDFKTSKKPKPREWIEHYFVQAMAYGCMLYEMKGISVKKLVIIMACENGECVVYEEYDKSKYIKLLGQYIRKFVGDKLELYGTE